MFIKAIYHQQIHVLKANNIKTFQQLSQVLHKAFKNLPSKVRFQAQMSQGRKCIDSNDSVDKLIKNSSNKIKLYILDENVDQATQSNVQQLQKKCVEKNDQVVLVVQKQGDTAIYIHSHSQKQILPSESTKQFSHQLEPVLFVCNNCNTKFHKGTFYRCSLCNDYDICQKCQQSTQHDHPLIKIKNPQYKTLKIFAVLPEEIQELAQTVQNQNKQSEQNIVKEQKLKIEIKQQRKVKQNNTTTWWGKVVQLKKNYIDKFLFGDKQAKEEVQNFKQKELEQVSLQNIVSRSQQKVEIQLDNNLQKQRNPEAENLQIEQQENKQIIARQIQHQNPIE